MILMYCVGQSLEFFELCHQFACYIDSSNIHFNETRTTYAFGHKVNYNNYSICLMHISQRQPPLEIGAYEDHTRAVLHQIKVRVNTSQK